jgi:TP901 family phage tail tape measure protein
LSLTPIGDIGIALKADADDFAKTMQTSKESVGLLTGSLRGLSAAVRNMGIAITAGSAIAGAGMVALAQNTARTNEKFRELETISSEVEDAQARYGQLVSDINTEMGLQANKADVLSGLYQSLSAGVDAAEQSQREFLTTAAELAVVGQTDLQTTVDVLSTSINAYGKSTDFANLASASLFTTVQLGKTRMEELAPVMGRVSAIGSDLGVSIQEAGAAMALLTRTGFESRVAATGLRAVMRTFLKPAEDMQNVLLDIATQNDLFASSMGEAEDTVRDIAESISGYRSELEKLEEVQTEAGDKAEDASTKIQEARLLEMAIEQDRRSEVEETLSQEVSRLDTLEEVSSFIEEKRLEQRKARLEEEKAVQQSEDLESKITDLQDKFTNLESTSGDLGEGIGNLVLDNQGFIETLTEVNSMAEEQGKQLSDIFPESRALQAATALLADDTETLRDIYKKFPGVVKDVSGELKSLSEEQGNFDPQKVEKARKAYEDFIGPIQKFRNSISTVRESITELGQSFTGNTLGTIRNLAESFSNLVDKFTGLPEQVQKNVSQFALLGASIGLILGPLLLLGGQIALIASTLGVGLLPILGVAVGAFALFAGGISTAMKRGEESEQLFSSMRNALSDLISFIKLAAKNFKVFILPELIEFGNQIISLFGSIANEIGSGNIKSNLASIAQSVGSVIRSFTKWISENEQLIASLVGDFASAVMNDVVPAIKQFALGLIAIIKDIDWKVIGGIAVVILEVASAIFPIIGAIGKWMQRNSDLIGTIITIAAVVGGLLLALGKLAVIFGPIIAAISSAITFFSALVSTLGLVSGTFAFVAAGIAKLAGIFTGLAKGISVLITVGKVLVGVVTTIAGILGLPVIATAALIAAIVATVAAIWYFRDEIKNALTKVAASLVILYGRFLTWKNDLISGAKKWGKNIIQSFIDGIKNKIGKLKSTLKSAANTVKDYLGFGSAPPALGEDYNPESWGGNVGDSLTSGMEGKESDVEESSTSLAESVKPPEDEMTTELESSVGDTSSNGQSQDTFGSDTTEENNVTVQKGAIDIDIEGVLDDELPGEVRKQVQKSLDEIIQRLEAKGVEVE